MTSDNYFIKWKLHPMATLSGQQDRQISFRLVSFITMHRNLKYRTNVGAQFYINHQCIYKEDLNVSVSKKLLIIQSTLTWLSTTGFSTNCYIDNYSVWSVSAFTLARVVPRNKETAGAHWLQPIDLLWGVKEGHAQCRICIFMRTVGPIPKCGSEQVGLIWGDIFHIAKCIVF